MRRSARRVIVVTVVALVPMAAISGCSTLGVETRRDYPSPIDPQAAAISYDAAAAIRGRDLSAVCVEGEAAGPPIAVDSQTIRRIAEKAMPAVVSIYAEAPEPSRVNLFSIPIPGTSFWVPVSGTALGSGFFVHPSGYILSNNHILENVSNIKARLADGTSHDLVVVASDAALDIALLRVSAPSREFSYIPLGDSADVGVGDRVVAIGNPLGLGYTVSEGIIRSQMGRSGAEGRSIQFLQTDTVVNPASSGGPVVTLTGAAIGINTAVAASVPGVAFSVPSSQVREFLQWILGGSGDLHEQPKPHFRGASRALGE